MLAERDFTLNPERDFMIRMVTMQRARLLLAGSIALLTVLAVPAGAAADASKHLVKVYKVEKHVDLQGEFPDNTKTAQTLCRSGDYAIDGMWRVDHVDQANPQLGELGDERDVTVSRSFSDLQQVGGDRAKWNFELTNNADGRAQVKLFAVCLGGKTAEGGHQHNIVVTAKKKAASFPGSDYSNSSLNCGAGKVAVGGGFRKISGGSVQMKTSYPNATPSNSWSWNFAAAAPASVEVSELCVSTKTQAADGHAHTISLDVAKGSQDLKKGVTQEKSAACDEQSKALAAGVKMATSQFASVQFLGMDPRPKSRAFKFVNSDPANDKPVSLATVCVADRTSKQVAP